MAASRKDPKHLSLDEALAIALTYRNFNTTDMSEAQRQVIVRASELVTKAAHEAVRRATAN